MTNIRYRKSQYQDIGEITELLLSSFGNLALNEGALKRIDGQYLVAVDEMSHIVALSGIVDDGSDIPVITFTCTHPKYRGRHIMDDMFTHMLREWDMKKKGAIALYAWNTGVRNAHIHTIATSHGFCLIEKSFVNRRKGITPSCHGCIYQGKNNCRCCDDLYVRNI